MNRALALVALASLLLAACTPIVTEQQLEDERSAMQDSGDVPVMTDDSGAVVVPARDPSKPLPYEFYGIQQWFNLDGNLTNRTDDKGAPALKREDLLGKVVLVDFWTYSCINCIRTLPYVTSWDEKYRDKGLVVVGIHAPEFDFEREPANVQAALVKYGIRYPVGLDNGMQTWNAYENHYWPHSYLFDRDGKLVFDHIGEGNYDEIEERIQKLLAVDVPLTEVVAPVYNKIGSPEIYLGGTTNRGNVDYDLSLGEHTFTLLSAAKRDTVQLGGAWMVEDEFLLAKKDAKLQLKYSARDIHLVAGGKGVIGVTVDGKVMPQVDVDGQQLYTLASTEYKEQTIVLEPSEGLELYSFTFG